MLIGLSTRGRAREVEGHGHGVMRTYRNAVGGMLMRCVAGVLRWHAVPCGGRAIVRWRGAIVRWLAAVDSNYEKHETRRKYFYV